MRSLLALALAGTALSLEHGWDCISCGSNSMLAANFGTWRADFTLSDPWWVDAIASSYAVVMLNNFWKQGPGSYNGTGTDSKVAVARALKARNPALKVFFYQPADRLGDTAYVTGLLAAHPEWWLRDDHGNLIPFGDPKGSRPQIDTSAPGAQDAFANLSISLFHDRAEAGRLLDGVFVDGTSYTGAARYGPNVSAARYERLFAGKMLMLAKMHDNLRALNPGAEVHGNPLLEYGQITPAGGGGGPPAPLPPGADWNTSLAHYDGAFDEMFGTFGTMDGDGSWDARKMRVSFDAIANASRAGKTIVVHAIPGPAGVNDPAQGGLFPTRGAPGNQFHVAAWAGPTPVPNGTGACRDAAATMLVQSLAPFLIVATERVFFGYGWFYNLEDGYIPCRKAGVECGMPAGGFPEFGKPLGAPAGPAATDAARNVWTRRFAHASVSVDLRDRALCKIVWDADLPPPPPPPPAPSPPVMGAQQVGGAT